MGTGPRRTGNHRRQIPPIGTFGGLDGYKPPSMTPHIRFIKPKTPFGLFPLLLLTCLCGGRIAAQDTLGVRISALTTAERDAIASSAQGQSHLKVIYACVPAGVIVFADSQASSSREAAQGRLAPLLSQALPANRIAAWNLTLRAAEAACETTRDQ